MRGAAALLLFAAPLLIAAGPPPGASSCSGCHGAAAGGIPPIAGRPASDLAGAMRAFRDGTRKATLMDRLMKGFTDAEITAIAAFWANPS